jgi:ribosome biogenesis GTPase / thiamine phosphate phosphatase
LADRDSSDLQEGSVLRARSGFYRVLTDAGEVECGIRGRLKRQRQRSNLIAIGDRVRISLLPDGSGMVEEVEPRRSRFSRLQPGGNRSWREDVLVANLDQVLIVFAVAEPRPHLRMVDRFLVVAEHNEVPTVLVANKLDLAGDSDAESLFGGYETIGYQVVYTSARTGAGLEQLRSLLGGRTSVVTGPSGVGKSSLLNAIQPGLRLDTGAMSDAVGKGRHTTVEARLLPVELPAGGWVADTPGLREIGLWQIPTDQLAWCFREFRPHLGACGFNDCRHLVEPRCAVRAAVEAGAISPLRHDSYRRLATDQD